ncbi:sulfotransferase family protein [Halorhodospira sp. 9621]|uniref:sulfotransferase family protein n=1 Tax=Halorhodospira sp. 9621 TaxID=2899135 RepID=UPI001EE7F5E0|nr:sulfotransferase family protein [Halorhodospira sp. 9621]MCG5533618.1 sulfotransferase family protein [Halorhodospira sp. 9621]
MVHPLLQEASAVPSGIAKCWRPFYRAYPPRCPLVFVSSLNRRVAVYPPREYVWVRIPKAANSTIAATLWAAMAEAGDAVTGQAGSKDSDKQRFVRPSALSAEQVRAVRERYFKFIFVRNPYTRVLSAYLNKGRPGKDRGRKFGQTEALAGTRAGFERFCRYLANGGLRKDAHWYPQSGLCPFSPVELDFIGRMETLGEDLERLLIELGLPWQGIVQAGPQPTRARARVAEFYTEESRRLVASLYAEDFRAFGYEQELEAV